MKKIGIKPSASLSKSVSGRSALPAAAIKGGLILPDLKKKTSDINKIIMDIHSGTPRMIEINPGEKSAGVYSSVTAGSPKDKAVNFLNSKKELLKISDPSEEFVLVNEHKDELGMSHLRFAQTFKGMEVWGK